VAKDKQKTRRPKRVISGEIDEANISVPKPKKFSTDKFKSKRAAAMANVETLLTALPHHSISQAKDFVRLHPDEEKYWSPELCFVNVPVKSQKRDTLHLIDEELAMRYLPPARILRFRLALATKPNDVSSVTFRARTSTTIGMRATNKPASKPRRSGCKRLVGRKKGSKPTRSTSRAIQTPFRRRNGRRKRSTKSSAEHSKEG